MSLECRKGQPMSSPIRSLRLAQHYNRDFYADQVPGSLRSATAVLETLFAAYKPTSLLDIGCGQGTWLAAAERLGVRELHGMDGPWVGRDALLSSAIEFTPVDMEQAFPIGRRYDLAMSVEVAEHLSEGRAADMVGALCRASDVVLFGAATVGQGGENHINEQRPSYWADLFERQGYVCLDAVRPGVWANELVAPWYRQNTLVYVNQDRPDLLAAFGNASTPPMLDVIHPVMFERRVETSRQMLAEPSLRLCLGLLKSYLQNLLGTKAIGNR